MANSVTVIWYMVFFSRYAFGGSISSGRRVAFSSRVGITDKCAAFR